MTFNPHGNKTSNGVTIIVGLKVLDYDRREGVVVEDRTSEYQCKCDHPRRNDFADAPACDKNTFCDHDHWFEVKGENGTKSFNGSRLKAI